MGSLPTYQNTLTTFPLPHHPCSAFKTTCGLRSTTRNKALAGPLSESLHIQIGQRGSPVREFSTLYDGAHLFHAQHQLLESFMVYGRGSR